LGPEDEDITVLRNVGNCIPNFFGNFFISVQCNYFKANKENTGYWKLKEFMGQYGKTRSEVCAKIIQFVIYIKTGMGTHMQLRRLE
jgi:hypothetical protein